MQNPFSEIKDRSFFNWLWSNNKLQTTLVHLIGLLLVVAPPIFLEGIFVYSIVITGVIWSIGVGLAMPFADYLNLKANYDAFEKSINGGPSPHSPDTITSGDREVSYMEHPTRQAHQIVEQSSILIDGVPVREKYKRIILAGPAGSGKDYLRDKLEEKGFPIDVSYTTRPMREGEIPGKTYNYIGEDHFKHLLNKKKFYESVNFNGAYYGTLKSNWEESLIFIMTPSGIEHITEEDRKNCVVVYLYIDEGIRRERMQTRSDNGFDQVERRIKADNKDFKNFLEEADVIVTNPLFDSDYVIEDILRKALLSE